MWGINEYDWVEGTGPQDGSFKPSDPSQGVTWNNWGNGTDTSNHTLLGEMTITTHGICTFSSPALTQRVQEWINGSKPNYGLLLTYDVGAGETQYYGSFWSREYGPSHGQIAPTLVIDHTPVPEPATMLLFLPGLISIARHKK